MNIAQLKAFIAVVDEGSFSAAARSLGVSQPAITMQVKALEDELGVVLLDRNYRRIDLTDAGRELEIHSRNVLVEIDAARQNIIELSGVCSGPLLIAASTTPGDYVIPRMLGVFLEKYPLVDVSISVLDSEDVIRAVEDLRADIGITGAKIESSRVDFTPFAEDELVVIAHPKNPLVREAKVALADLCEEPWIMRTQGSGTQAVTQKILKAAKIDCAKLPVVVELGTGEAIVSAVEGGLGIAMVSRLVAEKAIKLNTVGTLDLAHGIKRPFYMVQKRGSSSMTAKAFAESLLECSQEEESR